MPEIDFAQVGLQYIANEDRQFIAENLTIAMSISKRISKAVNEAGNVVGLDYHRDLVPIGEALITRVSIRVVNHHEAEKDRMETMALKPVSFWLTIIGIQSCRYMPVK